MARQLVREIARQWAALLERGMDDGDIPKRDPEALASLVLAMTVGVWRWYRPGGSLTLDEVREFVCGACLRVVGPGRSIGTHRLEIDSCHDRHGLEVVRLDSTGSAESPNTAQKERADA